MKVIDLLNKIASGEKPPKKIKYLTRVYEYRAMEEDYGCFVIDHYEYFLDNINVFDDLNNEVEIIEEDKEIEEINMEWFKQVDMFEPKSVELAIEMLAKQLNILSKAVNELKKGK